MVELIIRYSGPVVTLSEAKERGIKFYFTGRACLSGHIDRRYVSMAICVSCKREQAARYRIRLPKRAIELGRKRGRAFNARFGHALSDAIARAKKKLPALGDIKYPNKFRRYGISPEQFVEMYVAQDGRCKICRRRRAPFGNARDSIAIDHCHATGKIRGLLCNDCNRGLGSFVDNPEFLRSAIGYLANALTIPS